MVMEEHYQIRKRTGSWIQQEWTLKKVKYKMLEYFDFQYNMFRKVEHQEFYAPSNKCALRPLVPYISLIYWFLHMKIVIIESLMVNSKFIALFIIQFWHEFFFFRMRHPSGVNFTNVLCTAFTCVSCACSFFVLTF